MYPAGNDPLFRSSTNFKHLLIKKYIYSLFVRHHFFRNLIIKCSAFNHEIKKYNIVDTEECKKLYIFFFVKMYYYKYFILNSKIS